MHVSPAGRALIERNEGCVLHAYRDVVGVLTIGYGCTGPGVFEGQVISQAEADAMLSSRLADEFEPGLSAAIGSAPTTQPQFDAMASLEYNIGVGALRHSSVLLDHKLGRHAAAAAAFLLWDKAGGAVLTALLRRRRDESQLYLSGAAPDAQATAPEHPDAQPTARGDIADVQRALNAAGIDPPLAVDGLFGPDTRDAIAAYQADRGMPRTGIPDAATTAALGVAANDNDPPPGH